MTRVFVRKRIGVLLRRPRLWRLLAKAAAVVVATVLTMRFYRDIVAMVGIVTAGVLCSIFLLGLLARVVEWVRAPFVPPAEIRARERAQELLVERIPVDVAHGPRGATPDVEDTPLALEEV